VDITFGQAAVKPVHASSAKSSQRIRQAMQVTPASAGAFTRLQKSLRLGAASPLEMKVPKSVRRKATRVPGPIPKHVRAATPRDGGKYKPIHSTGSCCRANGEAVGTAKGRWRACQAACDKSASCNFISFSNRWRFCFLCHRCERFDASKLGEAGMYRSWRKVTPGLCVHVCISPDVSADAKHGARTHTLALVRAS